MKAHNTTGRIVAGGVMAMFGIVLLIGAYTYRLDRNEALTNPLAGPLLDSLSLIFMALAGVFIVAGLFLAAQALRRAVRAQQMGIDSGFGGQDRQAD